MNLASTPLRQSWPRPSRPRPIVIIGAGDIVRDAHLPAYRKAGLPVAGVFDLRREVAEARAKEFDLPRVFDSVAEAIAVPDAIFDLGIPPNLRKPRSNNLPDGAAVLSQKPMGNSLDMAKRIVAICQRKKLRAAVNFQFRFCPSMLAIQDLDQARRTRRIGRNRSPSEHRRRPGKLFRFCYSESRVEIQIHTVHYLDTIRMLLGDPRARVRPHGEASAFSQTRQHTFQHHSGLRRHDSLLPFDQPLSSVWPAPCRPRPFASKARRVAPLRRLAR